MHETLLIDCSGNPLPVVVEFKDRKRLSISVHADGSVSAIVPLGRARDDILSHLRRRLSWINKQRRYFERFHPQPSEKHYISGETHLYLGRQYRLHIRKSEMISVKLAGKFFHVEVPNVKDSDEVAAAMSQWYKSHADRLFQKRVDCAVKATPTLRLKVPVNLRIRKMEKRWGSCSKAGTITLNVDLVKTPLHCVDYVIMHELCHLLIHNHGSAFERLLGRCMPDWKTRKERLESIVIR